MGRKSKTTVINSLEENSDTITDNRTIAHELSNHFSTTADKISAEAEKNNEKPIGDKDASVHLSFIPEKQNPFKFQAITAHNIIRCISKMKNMPNLQGKGIYISDNYRPISVISVTARLFEKLVHEQLFLYFNDYLSKNNQVEA